METDNMKFTINKLIEMKKTISVMESCTGGGFSNCITNTSGSSEAFKFGAVTYSNEHKIKLGVSKEFIEKFSVYSSEVAREMSKKISDYSNSDYGVGITGKLDGADKEDTIVFMSIYDREKNSYLDKQIKIDLITRIEGKEKVIDLFINTFLDYIIKL